MMLAVYVLVGVVLFVILTLSIPMEMAFDTNRPGSKTRLGWAFGLLWKDMGGKEKKPKTPKKKKRKRSGLTTLLSSITTRGVASGLLKLCKRIIGGVVVRKMDASLRMGLDDPADTGMLYSVVWPILVPLNHLGHGHLRMDVCFEEEVLDFAGRGHVRIIPAQMIWAVLMFGLSPSGLRLVRKVVTRRWS